MKAVKHGILRTGKTLLTWNWLTKVENFNELKISGKMCWL